MAGLGALSAGRGAMAGGAVLLVALAVWALVDRGPRAPAPEAAPEAPGSPPALAAADDAAAAPAPRPRFDLVRVDPRGDAVVAGQAAPEAEVAVLVDGAEAARTRADAQGLFVVLFLILPGEGPRAITLEARDPSGLVMTSAETVLVAPSAAAASAEPSPAVGLAAAEPTAAPAADLATEPSLALAPAEPAAEGTAGPSATLAAAEPAADGAAAQSLAPAAAEPSAAKPSAAEPSAEGAAEPALADVSPPAGAAPMATGSAAPEPSDLDIAAAPPQLEAADSDGVASRTLPAEPASSPPVAAPTASPAAEARPVPPVPEVVAAAPPAPPSEVPPSAPSAPEAVALPQAGPLPEPEPAPARRAAAAPLAAAPDAPPPAVDPLPPERAAPQPAAQPAPPPALADALPAAGAAASPADATAMAAPAAPVVVIAGDEGLRVLQSPTVPPQVPAAPGGQVVIDAITYSGSGDVMLAGRAGGDAAVLLYLDNRLLERIAIAPDGGWQSALPPIDTGTYTLRADAVDAAGAVVSRFETPFRREDPALLAGMAADGGADGDRGARARVVTVQPGYTLWGISRATYGSGLLYVQVFQANRDQIRNPDLIYPGQVFTLPDLPDAAP